MQWFINCWKRDRQTEEDNVLECGKSFSLFGRHNHTHRNLLNFFLVFFSFAVLMLSGDIQQLSSVMYVERWAPLHVRPPRGCPTFHNLHCKHTTWTIPKKTTVTWWCVTKGRSVNDVAKYREEQRVVGVYGDVLKIKPQIVSPFQINAMHDLPSERVVFFFFSSKK